MLLCLCVLLMQAQSSKSTKSSGASSQKSSKATQSKSAETGRFVSKDDTKKNPSTTYTYPRKGKH